MIINVFAIYDTAVNAYSQPYYSHTNGSALRAFADHVNDPNSNVNKHPADYSLFHLGTFNDETGELAGIKPTRIGTATEYKNKE